MTGALSLWTVYNHAGGYAMGEWQVDGTGDAKWMGPVQFSMTLEGIRELIPAGLYRLPRNDTDAPDIVETWI
jgi:hypothetical protein